MVKKLITFLLLIFALCSCLKQEDYRIDLAYSEDQLRYIACPLGGLGTGNLLLNGYGAIRNIEIFNEPAMDDELPYMTFFGLYTQTSGGTGTARILEREMLPGYTGPRGVPSNQLGGLPRFKNAVFHNAYPSVELELQDDSVPLTAKMHAWSPMIPVDVLNSSLPAAVIEWELANPGKEPVKFSLVFLMGNPMQTTADEGLQTTEGSTIMPYISKEWKGMTFSTPAVDSLLPGNGQFRVLFPEEGNIALPVQGDMGNEAQLFWKNFSLSGDIAVRMDTVVQTESGKNVAALHIDGSLDPGETTKIPFLFNWHIPYRTKDTDARKGKSARDVNIEKNHYAVRFQNIDTTTSYLLQNYSHLKKQTLAFSNAMITSSVPQDVLDAAISNIASLHTNLVSQNAEGDFYFYGGLDDNAGLLPGNNTTIWNYAQTTAMLFPSAERNVRETGFRLSTYSNGFQGYNTVNKSTEDTEEYQSTISTDGQLGNIISVYREWKMSGNREWLGYVWPNVKAALEFAWNGPGELVDDYPWMNDSVFPWDPYQEGVLNISMNTAYGVDLYGFNMMTGSLYLAALKACSEMALAMNEPQAATDYADLFERGKEKYLELLWNGNYFIQRRDTGKGNSAIKNGDSVRKAGFYSSDYQVDDGCLSDQLFGQYLAYISGLGDLMDPDIISEALLSVFQYNFTEEIRSVENTGGIYALNGESGLVNCTWPSGGEPEIPLKHSGEVWSGVEYQVAASLIFAGHVEEGLKIVSAVRSRYNGASRNPFSEIENGRYFGRALASWSVYQAMAGYMYDGTKHEMLFAPAEDVLPVRFFWSTGEGWGTIDVSRGKVVFSCLGGTIKLKRLLLEGKSFFVFREFIPSHPAEISYNSDHLVIEFPEDLSLAEGGSFIMELP